MTDEEMVEFLENEDAAIPEADWTHPALRELIDAQAAREAAEERLAEAVARFREETGASWEGVGQVLGLARQGAHARYAQRKTSNAA